MTLSYSLSFEEKEALLLMNRNLTQASVLFQVCISMKALESDLA